jgi:hypothetical protein
MSIVAQDEDRVGDLGQDRASLTTLPRMAINNGSPVQLEHGDSLIHARRFLSHPLSTEFDGRLVAACELLDARRKWLIRTLTDSSEPTLAHGFTGGRW